MKLTSLQIVVVLLSLVALVQLAHSGDVDPAKDWKTFKNPVGLMMKYPSDWTTQEQPGILQLVPPDAVKNDAGPAEVYLVTGTDSVGITEATDERVTQAIDIQMNTLVPFLRRTEKIESVQAVKSPGTLLRFEGTNPAGKPIIALVFTTVLKGYAISVVALGEKDLIAKRAKVSQAMFETINDAEEQTDPALVGRWHYWTYSGAKDGSHGAEHDYHLTLAADGSAALEHRGESSAIIKGKDAGGNDTVDAGIAGVSNSADKGHWSAGGGKFYIRWEKGASQAYEYKVTGEAGQRRIAARAVGSNDKPAEWTEE